MIKVVKLFQNGMYHGYCNRTLYNYRDNQTLIWNFKMRCQQKLSNVLISLRTPTLISKALSGDGDHNL